ncbi:uncharacterized protein LY89DRAFT_54513 [Mollisia scopiformis]|uniref:Uncharacterized protein n=1 Tax=Mollisia scopiformis TaxID=149040 RepID=A0A194XCL2_MOLSC|nr:uncharacterized protein LY89DRAFT_54513 [Mollisia scopiformis]KUJ17487.1 hypothetical protein LY89DRAFT_54513 [Mollisia scopiformis]
MASSQHSHRHKPRTHKPPSPILLPISRTNTTTTMPLLLTLTAPSQNDITDKYNSPLSTPSHLIIDLENPDKKFLSRKYGHNPEQLQKELHKMVKDKLAKRVFVAKFPVYQLPMEVVQKRPWIYEYVRDVAQVDAMKEDDEGEREMAGRLRRGFS